MAFLFGLTLWVAALVILVSTFIYFLPTLIASLRGHKQFPQLAMLNLFLGWTAIGWLGALVWALAPQKRLHTTRVGPDDGMITVN